MDPRALRQYRENQILTAPREQLLLMLFDGAIRFGEQAKAHLAEKRIEEAVQGLVKAQRIVAEVMGALDRSIGEELYRNLTGLYGFAYLRLVHAGARLEPAPIDEALTVLRRLRETWGEAVEQARREKHPESIVLQKAKAQPDPGAR